MNVLQVMADASAQCSTNDRLRCDTGLPTVGANASALSTIMTVVFGILGALCVLLIVIGALRMLEAQGDPQGVKKGRNTIIYAALGLVLAISAQVIVALVVGRL